MAKIHGREKHLKRLQNMRGPEAVRLISKALYAAGNMIQVEAQISMTTGAVSGAGHKASVAPNPPLADTHTLVNSIETVLVEPLKVEVSANAPYAAVHEFGGSKTPARPFMRPAVARKKREAVELIEKAVSKVIRESGA